MRGASWAVLAAWVIWAGPARGQDEIPAPFAPLEHLLGGWGGTVVPAADRVHGNPVKHSWAWKFDKGAPVAMTLTLDKDKVLKQGTLTYDEAARQYRLEGTDVNGKAVAYAGNFGPDGKLLELDRLNVPAGGTKERITLRILPENKIRYILWVDRQEPGAPRFSRVFESGLTKAGESISAAGAAVSLPKCIITGGSATMTVSFNGQTFPICCTGCRDEFEDNPEKYVEKARRLASQAASKPAAKSAAKDDGAFDGLITDSDKPASKPRKAAAASRTRNEPPAEAEAVSDPEPAPAATPKPRADDSSKADTYLKLGQALEKSNKAGALGYYRRIVKDYPGTPAAKAAGERIKAMEKK